MAAAPSKKEAICSYILQQIALGNLRAGDKLPSEKQLCGQFGVSRITAQNALNLLESRGDIYRVRGSGSFVGRNAAPPASILPLIMNSLAPEGRHMEIIEGASDYLAGRRLPRRRLSHLPGRGKGTENL